MPEPTEGGTVLILGSTSGIMRALAREFAEHGHDLMLAGRDEEELRSVAADLTARYRVKADPVRIDVLETESHTAWAEKLLALAGDSFSGVVLGIGYLGDQSLAERDFVEARRILETNLVACVSLLNPLADRLEARGSGFICVLSSVAGLRGRQSNYIYGCAKSGLSTYLQGLRNRLFHAGVHVTTVLPGFVDTATTYGKEGIVLAASPEAVARGVYRAVRRRRNVVYLPWFWRQIMWIVRGIPEPLFKRLRL